MANEFKHITVGTELTQAEFELITAHQFDAQATGDILYASSATQLSRLGIGSAGAVLIVVGGIPAWSDTAKLMYNATTGGFGIGATAAKSALEISWSFTATADQFQSILVQGTITSDAINRSMYGTRLLTNFATGGFGASLWQGAVISNALSGAGTITTAEGLYVDAPSGGTVTNRYAARFGGNVVPEADNSRSLGLAALRWSDLRSVLINGADYGFDNKWRLLESERYIGYGKGIALDKASAFEDGKSGPTNPSAKPLFAITEDFIEFKGQRIV